MRGVRVSIRKRAPTATSRLESDPRSQGRSEFETICTYDDSSGTTHERAPRARDHTHIRRLERYNVVAIHLETYGRSSHVDWDHSGSSGAEAKNGAAGQMDGKMWVQGVCRAALCIAEHTDEG
jgi:hypothetical protein